MNGYKHTLIKSASALTLMAVSFTATSTFAVEQETVNTPQGKVIMAYPDKAEMELLGSPQTNPFATRDQRLKAQPAQWNESANPSLDKGADAGAMLLRGGDSQPGNATGGTASPMANEEARAEFRGDWELLESMERDGMMVEQPTDQFDGTHGVYTRYAGNLRTQQWKAAPFNKIGKLYFNTPSGGSSYCTANLVTSKSHIVTAAHCIYTRGQGFNSNFVFVPADRYGAAPYGSFNWSSATVLNQWISNGGRRWDVGLIKLRNNASNRPATYYVGWLGRSWNYGYTQNLHSHGYASNLSTQYTNICSAQSFYSGTEGTDVLVKGCDMTFGSSGGGWMRNYTPFSHGGNSVFGVVSGPHIGAFGTTYVGPRFSSSNIIPLCNAQNC